MIKFTPHKPIAKCSDAELLALLDETSGEFRKLVLMEMGKRVAEEYRKGLGMSDLAAAGLRGHDSSPWGADASRQRSRRNPSSRASRAIGKAYWWMIAANRIDKTGTYESFNTFNEMMERVTSEGLTDHNRRRGGMILTSKKKVSRSTFIDWFRAAYPDIHLEL